jgi:putative ABC transport system permease protein
MLANYFSVAWRNARRDKLHAGINVLGLSLGLAAAILIAVYARDELTFNRFLPGYENVYRVYTSLLTNGVPSDRFGGSHHGLAAPLKAFFPEIESATRVAVQSVGIRSGSAEVTERVVSVDPDFFAVLPFELVRGDSSTALAAPDSVVLTQAMAIKYFGAEECIGKTLLLDRVHPVRVSAVMANLPSNSSFEFGIILNGKAPFTNLAKLDAGPPMSTDNFNLGTEIYLRLKPGATSQSINARLPEFRKREIPDFGRSTFDLGMDVMAIGDIHLHSKAENDPSGGSTAAVMAISLVGGLILLVAGINFVNLVTARATRRAVEVGIRKVMGASRKHLMAQFMGESLLYALVSMVFAVALVEIAMSRFNEFLGRTIVFDYWRNPTLAIGILVAALLFGLIAGVYPALVLSSFRPAAVLKTRTAAAPGTGKLRQILVVLQFVVSIGLLIATSVIYRQTEFATNKSLNFDQSHLLIVSLTALDVKKDGESNAERQSDPAKIEAFRQRLLTVPGVKTAAPSFTHPGGDGKSISSVKVVDRPDLGEFIVNQQSVDFGLLEAYGLPLIAGRNLSRDFMAQDAAPLDAAIEGSVILNETAIRKFGFASPQAAIGKRLKLGIDSNNDQTRVIVGVVPDVPLQSIRYPVEPAVFYRLPENFGVMNVRLDGADAKATLAGIDRVWAEFVPDRPIQRWFLDDRIERLYKDVRRQGELFAGFSAIAVLIGCLGLFGLSAYTAERRIKEIGIRKALGASSFEIVRLLVWQFARPVLLANAIAWPVAWAIMGHWLDGFAYHVEMSPMSFLIAGLGALAIALLTTAFHALNVARQRPVLALRYE